MNFRDIIIKNLNENIQEFDLQGIEALLEIPKNEDMGDIAFPCFQLSKIFRKSPVVIASELSEKLSSSYYDVSAVGGYINFKYNREILIKSTIEEILDKNNTFSRNIGNNRKLLVEYSSANISKELHIGHLRGIMIGSSLMKILQRMGYDVFSINHLGDYGINFGMMISAYLRWGNKEYIEKNGVRGLLELYVRFKEESENDPTLMQEAREWFKKLEEGTSEEATELWKWFKKISLDEYNRVYQRIGCRFDSYNGESFYSDMMPQVRQEMIDKGIIKIDDGAEIVDLSDENLPNAVVTTSSGTSLYITRDIAAALYRYRTYDFEKCLYVVGSEQRLHFEQLKAIIKKMGYDFYDKIVHVSHGLIMTPEGKISSRDKKNKLSLEEFLDLAVDKTLNIIKEKNPNLENKEDVSEMVGVGAVSFKELSTSVSKDYIFDLDQALSFEGETGPYLQYTNVRAESLLSKGKSDIDNYDISELIKSDSALSVVRELSQYVDAIEQAAFRLEPAVVSRYLIKLAKSFNRYYQEVTILHENKEIQSANILLVEAISKVLKDGMKLINMKAPKRM